MSGLKGKILTIWFERVLDTYHPEAKRYILSEKDRFLNPIGSTYRDAIERILDWLFKDSPILVVRPHIFEMVKIGVLNGYRPEDGSFSAILKACLSQFQDEIPEFDNICDRLTMLALEEQIAYETVRESLESLRRESLRPKVYKRLKTLYG